MAYVTPPVPRLFLQNENIFFHIEPSPHVERGSPELRLIHYLQAAVGSVRLSTGIVGHVIAISNDVTFHLVSTKSWAVCGRARPPPTRMYEKNILKNNNYGFE
jgi:hypothetical protein